MAAGDAKYNAAMTAAVMTGKFLFRTGLSPCVNEYRIRGRTIGWWPIMRNSIVSIWAIGNANG
jgi:hypothetical protein